MVGRFCDCGVLFVVEGDVGMVWAVVLVVGVNGESVGVLVLGGDGEKGVVFVISGDGDSGDAVVRVTLFVVAVVVVGTEGEDGEAKVEGDLFVVRDWAGVVGAVVM